jgi:hypothetical protein
MAFLVIQVLQEYVPPVLVDRIRITAQEGDKFWARNEQEAFDRVL